MAAPDGTAPEGISRSRLEAISDGVIAVAITLLVLGIDPPVPGDGETLWQALDADVIASLALFVLSFAVIARFWMSHHHAVRDLPSYVPAALVAANFGFLLMICLIPFSTTLFARNSDDMLALVIYACTFALVSVLLGIVMSAAHTAITLRTVAIPAIFLLAIPTGLLFGPAYAPTVWVLLFVLAFDRADALLARRIR